jgi:N6-adenosine-specific RNA methylase IME4/ParB-like chromosome segregation protein Spo0J
MRDIATMEIAALKRQLTFHPLAAIFPLIEGKDFDALVADIAAHGIREPIWIYEGQIIDGRNRYRAAAIAGVDCPLREYTGDDPVAFVVSLNLKRRHLNESQRAMVAAKLATLRRGDNQHAPIGATSQSDAAELLNVARRSVQRAAEVRDHGAPELQAAVEAGAVSVLAASDIASKPIEEQQEIVARGEKEILEAAKRIRSQRAEASRTERLAKIAQISNADAPLPQNRKYPIILADPPWKFQVYEIETGQDRCPEAHYPTMELDDICKLPIANLATPDAALFLWATVPCLQQAFQVLDAWGFKYKSNYVWDKLKTGLGFWNHNQHEHLLIATRGNFPAPRPGDCQSSVIQSARREHSRKPDEAYALIEQMYPELPKIELFARGGRDGWAAWGNQVSPLPTAEAVA